MKIHSMKIDGKKFQLKYHKAGDIYSNSYGLRQDNGGGPYVSVNFEMDGREYTMELEVDEARKLNQSLVNFLESDWVEGGES